MRFFVRSGAEITFYLHKTAARLPQDGVENVCKCNHASLKRSGCILKKDKRTDKKKHKKKISRLSLSFFAENSKILLFFTKNRFFHFI